MRAIDTNVLLYARYKSYAQHHQVYLFVNNFMKLNQPFCLSWQICYEYIRIATHPQFFGETISADEALKDLQPYLSHPQCRMLYETDLHQETLVEILKSIPQAKANFIHDCHYAALLKEHAIKQIITCDLDYKKFDFLEVINPLVER